MLALDWKNLYLFVRFLRSFQGFPFLVLFAHVSGLPQSYDEYNTIQSESVPLHDHNFYYICHWIWCPAKVEEIPGKQPDIIQTIQRSFLELELAAELYQYLGLHSFLKSSSLTLILDGFLEIAVTSKVTSSKLQSTAMMHRMRYLARSASETTKGEQKDDNAERLGEVEAGPGVQESLYHQLHTNVTKEQTRQQSWAGNTASYSPATFIWFYMSAIQWMNKDLHRFTNLINTTEKLNDILWDPPWHMLATQGNRMLSA